MNKSVSHTPLFPFTETRQLWYYIALVSQLFSGVAIQAQVVNGYAKVNSVAGTVLTVSNVDETYDSFEDGEYLVIMQMQDDVIGANTADNSSFGDLSSIQSAGLYEVRQIVSHTEGAGVPTTITLDQVVNTYNTTGNTSVQIITMNLLSSGDYTTSFDIYPLTWDGNTGGVVAFEVGGTLTLANNINADALGFRGGNRSANFYIGGTACYTTPYCSNSTNHADKGEGIYKSTTAIYTTARAKILNGGGGGIQINTGGGGGGNYTAGGIGGPGWDGTGSGCALATGGYGYGGIALAAYIAGNRIFMGGGGGGGQQNNSVATDGGNGGGIILIKADVIETLGSCGGVTISANGEYPGLSGNDGGGGGGAAGSIVLEVNGYSIAATCPLTIEANGGDGGDINSSTHAAGGGGGQGVIIFSGAQPSTNTTVTTLNGAPGCSNSGCTVVAGSPSGSDDGGIFTGTANPLPIELLSFQAEPVSPYTVAVLWSTATEINNDYFTVYRSQDGVNWSEVGRVDGAGNSTGIITYELADYTPYSGTSYYRLKQTDFDGSEEYSDIIAVNLYMLQSDITVYPNPANEEVNIAFNEDMSSVVITDIQGKIVWEESVEQGQHALNITTVSLEAGMYFINIKRDGQLLHQTRLVVGR